MTCDAIEGATLVGLHNPCIAIPSSLINALSADELDQVILHEYAHVQRRDDWVRLAQSLILSALWIHPAAVLVSRAIDREREMACDEWVIARTGLPKAYARCLAHAAELRANIHSSPALLSAFVGRRRELGRRVEHVLAFKGQTRRWLAYTGAVAAAAAIAGVSVSMQGARFAEIGTVIFPIDSVKRLQQVQPLEWVRWVQPIQQVRQVRQVRHMQPVQEVPSPQSTGLASDVHDAAPPLLVTSTSLTAVLTEGRAFSTTTAAPIASIAPNAPIAPIAPDAPNHWSIEIASVARKTSVGIANAFGRAGVSLARSF
jgi:hypothetical protein